MPQPGAQTPLADGERTGLRKRRLRLFLDAGRIQESRRTSLERAGGRPHLRMCRKRHPTAYLPGPSALITPRISNSPR